MGKVIKYMLLLLTFHSLIDRKREISKKCTFSRSGRKISQKELDQMEDLERRKNDELCAARLEFIKLKNKKEARERELQESFAITKISS